MADLPITINASSAGSSGFQDLLTFVGQLSIPAPRIWGRPLRFLNQNYSPELADRGQTVTVHVQPIVSTTLMVDGVSLPNDDTAPTPVNMTLNRIRATKFSFSELYNAMKSGPAKFQMFLASRISGLLNDVERDVFSLAPTLTQNAGTYNSNLTEPNILVAHTNIAQNQPPIENNFVGLVKPGSTSWSALAQLTGFAQATYRGFQEMSPMVAGRLGQYTGNDIGGIPWHGVNWFETQSVPISGTSTSNIVFHPYAIGYVNRALVPPMAAKGVDWVNFEIDGVQFQMTISWNKDNFSSEVAIRALYGYAVLNNNWATELRA